MNPFGLNQNNTNIVVNEAVERSFLVKVYGWMALALAITGLVAVATASNPDILIALTSGPTLLVLIMGQLGLVLVLSAAINKLSPGIATGLFIVYSALTGLTFSFLFLVYTASSIAQVFFISAGTFAIASVFGYVTRRDLTSMGSLLIMALFGIILASIVNLFLQSSGLYWVLTYVGVLVFVGLIAYDTQRLKRMAYGVSEDGDMQRKAAVIGALALYLDFVNLFIRLLRIFGQRR
jgi:FtsH-binding integral membrane protein